MNYSPYKIEVKYIDVSFSSDEYTLEEFTEEFNNTYNRIVLEQAKAMEKEGFYITKALICSEYEGGYYGDGSAKLFMQFYRTENDKEYKNRLNIIKEEQDAKELAFKKKIEKNEKLRKLQTNPEYLNFLALKNKFKDI